MAEEIGVNKNDFFRRQRCKRFLVLKKRSTGHVCKNANKKAANEFFWHSFAAFKDIIISKRMSCCANKRVVRR
ncbi:MAG: hypothetical protein IPL35_02930 [Sphingobacteriales bacterium]|nr:hypothetical protein [Sphingobacteriales bacterium]